MSTTPRTGVQRWVESANLATEEKRQCLSRVWNPDQNLIELLTLTA
jgi:hypothetical protein